MKKNNKSLAIIDSVANALCAPSPFSGGLAETHGNPMIPNIAALEEMMERLRAMLFPHYFGQIGTVDSAMHYHVAASLDSILHILKDQIHRGLCFTCANGKACPKCGEQASDLALQFLSELPTIRELLYSDVKAAFEGDPAAKTPGEAIFCYPSIAAMTHHRIAHALYNLNVPIIPRILSEMAHSRTGIDIHPGAQIGEEFFIDHGTGVVIGETCIIGKKCRLYQGVTLGALFFVKDETGSLVKGQPRHPILEDNITVYAGATILGRITIGAESIIGGNVWLTHTVPPKSRIVQQRSTEPKDKEAIVGKKS